MASMDAATALLSAAIRAAIQAGAPRRTVAAVAASTAGALVVPFVDASQKRQSHERTAGAPGPSSDAVLRKSRASRRREKRREKKRHMEASEAASHVADADVTSAGMEHREKALATPTLCADMPPPKSPPRKKARGRGGGHTSNEDVDEPVSDASLASSGWSVRSRPSFAFTEDLLTARMTDVIPASVSMPPWPSGTSTNRR